MDESTCSAFFEDGKRGKQWIEMDCPCISIASCMLLYPHPFAAASFGGSSASIPQREKLGRLALPMFKAWNWFFHLKLHHR